jgi:quercetin dioxygenase-like cupin family protein
MLRRAARKLVSGNPQLLRAMSTSATSGVWKHHKVVPDTPEGFTMRGTFPTDENGVDVMMEKWEAGSSEPPHSHPGDDMTVVVEGKMSVQFFKKEGDKLVEDGEPLILNKGDAGYIEGGRIHDAKYLEDCKLVYVHDNKFGFVAEGSA